MLNIAFLAQKSYGEKSFELARADSAEFHFHDFRLTTTAAKWRGFNLKSFVRL